MLHNYTVIDLLGSTAAALLLTLFVFVPGYVVGWLTNVMDFRQQRQAMRVLWSTPLGISVVPVLVFLLGRRPWALWCFFGVNWAAFLVIFFRESLRRKIVAPTSRSAVARTSTSAPALARCGLESAPTAGLETGATPAGWFPISCPDATVRRGIIVVLLWAALAIFSLADLQLGHRLYNNVAVYDHGVRSAMTAAAVRSIPPVSPFFGGQPPVMLRYHYFWMLVCSLVTRLSGISPRLAMLGSVVWGGIALLSLIPIALRHLTGVRQGLGRVTLIGFALLTVTGLDLLPVLYISHFKAPVYADMEWWNVQITSWVDVLLWTPHHVLAMIACFVAFILLRPASRSRMQTAACVAIAALAFSSACGLSLLVTFTFALFIALWLLLAACRGWWDEFPLLLAAGTLALLLAIPALRMFLGPGGSDTGHSGFFGLTVREFPLGMRMLTRHFGWKQHLWIANLVLLPLNYFLELGFYAAAAWLRWRVHCANRTRMTREETAAWVVVVTSFLVGSFVRSNTLTSNDLGWRCWLPAQLVLLLWGAMLLQRGWSMPEGLSQRAWGWLRFLLIVGALGTAYQVVNLRLYPVEWHEADALAGQRTFALREIYGQLDALPRNAIVQYNPEAKDYTPHLLYSGHAAVVGLHQCGMALGGQLSVCEPWEAAIDQLFEPVPGMAASPASICRDYGIDALVVTDTDPVWKQPDSWVWKLSPWIANAHVRAFRCGR